MSFQDKYTEVVYILFYMQIHIGNDMGSGQYACDILHYNTGTCWNCYDGTITKYSGYLDNVCDNYSRMNEQKMCGGGYY